MLYRQNALIRKNRLGNFKSFVKDITLDPSMLVYLGNVLNIKGRPNENYARELMELYTCGIGYYTEGDVKEAARVLTGWKVGMFNDEPAKMVFIIPIFTHQIMIMAQSNLWECQFLLEMILQIQNIW